MFWTPFPIAAGQRVLKLSLWTLAVWLALSAPRERARADHLYLFPLGLVLGMLTMLAVWIAEYQGASLGMSAFRTAASRSRRCCSRRWRDSPRAAATAHARLLLILAFVYAFAIGSTPTTIALLVGFTRVVLRPLGPGSRARPSI